MEKLFIWPQIWTWTGNCSPTVIPVYPKMCLTWMSFWTFLTASNLWRIRFRRAPIRWSANSKSTSHNESEVSIRFGFDIFCANFTEIMKNHFLLLFYFLVFYICWFSLLVIFLKLLFVDFLVLSNALAKDQVSGLQVTPPFWRLDLFIFQFSVEFVYDHHWSRYFIIAAFWYLKLLISSSRIWPLNY
jgi:hypothetical protein